ncbi:hypothetical protein NBRC116589_14980 [Ruegeria sp. HU-ET01832]
MRKRVWRPFASAAAWASPCAWSATKLLSIEHRKGAPQAPFFVTLGLTQRCDDIALWVSKILGETILRKITYQSNSITKTT